MTIKLVQGLVDRTNLTGQSRAGTAPANTPYRTENVVAQATTLSSSVLQSEAAVAVLRTSRQSASGERLRPNEAESLMREIANRVRDSGDPSAASHGKLEYLVAQDHLT